MNGPNFLDTEGKPRFHPYAMLGGIARAGLSVSIAYSYSVRLYLPKNAATLEASGSLSPSLEAISIMLTRTGDTAARGPLAGMSAFSPDEALNVALATALDRLGEGSASGCAERVLKQCQPYRDATLEVCLAWEGELDQNVTLGALAEMAGISKSVENTKATLLTLQSLREELSGQAQEKRVLIRPEIQYSGSGWDASLSVTLDPWEHHKPSLCFLEPYWRRQHVEAFFQTPGSKAAQVHFSRVLHVLHSLGSDMTPIDSLRECLEMPFPIIKVMPESDTAKGSGLSASAPAYSINALRPILQSLTGDPALHKAHPGYAASFIRREATNLAFALSDITPFSAIATSIPVLLIVLCRPIRSPIDAAGPDMVSVTDILSIVERILKRLEETAEVGKGSGRLMPFMAESNAAVIVATKQFLDTLYAFDGRSLAIPPIIGQIATEPQAPAFRPEIGPFRRFNLAFSVVRYTAG